MEIYTQLLLSKAQVYDKEVHRQKTKTKDENNQST